MRHACEFGQHVIRDQAEQVRVPLRTRYPAIGSNAQVLLASFHNPNGYAHFAADLGGRHGAQERFVTESGAVVVLDRRRPGQVRGGRHSIQAERLAQRPAAVQVSEQDRKRAEMYAKREADQFKALAVKRQAGFAGYTDRNPSAWRELPAELRERIERFNALPKERQAVELDKMQRELADRYARDPKEIERSRQRQREQERGNGGLSR